MMVMTERRALLFARVTIFMQILTASVVHGFSPDITLISGVDYASGDYDQSAEFVIRSLPLTIKLDSKEWVARMQSSYLQIDSRPEGGQSNRAQGTGDTILFVAKKSWFKLKGIQFFQFGAGVKLPTASEEKQLGTGEKDWIVQLESFRQSGKWLPFGKLGYRWYGDSEDAPREDGAFGSIGLHYQLNARFSAGGLFDYRSANTVMVRGGKEFIPYLQYRLNNKWALGLYGVTGLSPASPNTGGGVQLIYRSARKR